MKNRAGFTLLEILMAIMLFGLGIMAIVKSQTESRRNVFKGEYLVLSVQLAQWKMTEMEMKFQKALDRDGLAAAIGKENGVFEAPYDKYKWEAELKESKVEMTSDMLLKLLQELGFTEDEALAQTENQGQKLVMTNLNKTMKDNFAELTIRVQWDEFGRLQEVPVVTHLIPAKPKIELKLTADE